MMKPKFKLLYLLLVVFCLSSFEEDRKIVVIDVGHGGNDMGAEHAGKSEKDIVLSGSKILKERVEDINSRSPEVLISLHLNVSKDENERGLEV